MSELFKKTVPHVISKNFYGVPVEGSEVQSSGIETKVPDYIEKKEKPELGFYGKANILSNLYKRKLTGQKFDAEREALSNKEVSKFTYKALTGLPDVVTDVATGALELSSNPETRQKAKALESSKVKLFGEVADILGEEFGVEAEKIVDKKTGVVQPYESLEGPILDLTVLFASGLAGYKALEKTKLFKRTPDTKTGVVPTSKDPTKRFIGDYKIQEQNKFTVGAKNFIKDITRGEVAFAPAAQILFNPDETIATQLKESEYLDKDNPIAPLVNYLAADENDSELKKRAKMLLQDGMIATGAQTFFKFLGFSLSKVKETSMKMFNKGLESLTTDEEGKLVDEVLSTMKKEVDASIEIPTVIRQDTEEAVRQLERQSFEDKSVAELAPTLLYRTKQRWLTINGFYTPEINNAYRMSRSRIRAGDNKAYNIALKLENNINSHINNSTGYTGVQNEATELVLKDTKIPTKLGNIKAALEINLDKIKIPLDERVGYLSSRFKLPEDLAESILESRRLIDDLSEEYLKLNQISYVTQGAKESSKELMREVIRSNIGSYINRSYKLYTQGSWTPPAKVVQDAEKYFVEEWLRTAGRGLAYENTSQAQKNAAARYARIEINKVLGKDKEQFNASISNSQKINESILKERQVIAPQIRALMGEIESPAVNVLQTASKLIDLVETNRYFNTVADLGAGGRPRYPALWDEATNIVRDTVKATVNAEKMIEVTYKGRPIDPSFVGEAAFPAGTSKIKPEDVFKDAYAVIDFGEFTRVGEVLGKIKKGKNAGKYKVKTKAASGADEEIYVYPKDMEIVVNDKLLRALTEVEYEKIIDKSPFIQHAQEVSNQGKLIESADHYYTQGQYIFRSKEAAPKGFETPITNTGSILDEGYYTTPELAKSLEGIQNTFLFSRYLHGSSGVNAWRYIKTTTQKNKTVLDPTTQMRNFVGGAQMVAANGWVPWKNNRIAGAIVKNQLSDMRTEEWNTMYTYFQQQGIANTQLVSAEWEALMRNADGKTMPEFTMWFTEKVQNLINKSGVELKANQVDSKWIGKETKFSEQVHNDPFDLPQKVYAEVDNFFKMSMWFSELETLKKAFPNTPLKQLMDDASKLIRNQLPNYDAGVPAGFKATKDFITGNFVSYTPEIIRTSANILNRSVYEITSGNPVLMKRGVARLGGFSLMRASWIGGSALGYTQMNVTSEQNEAIQTILEAPWSKRRNKIVGRVGDSFYYVDPTYLDPYDYFSGTAHAVLAAYHEGKFNGDSAGKQIQNAIITSVSEGLRFAHEESIGLVLYKEFQHAYLDDSGVGPAPNNRKIFRKKTERTVDTTLADAMKYLALAGGPGFISDARDLSRAAQGTPHPTTGEVKKAIFKLGEFATGVSVKEIDFAAILQRRAGEYSSVTNFDLPTVSRKIVSQKQIDAEAKRFGEAYIKRQTVKFEADQKFYRQLQAFQLLPTYNKFKIADILKERRARVSKKQLFTIMDGRFSPATLSDEKLEAAKEMYGEHHEVFRIIEAYTDRIKNTNLSPLTSSDEMVSIVKGEIKDIKKGKPTFYYFQESTYDRVREKMLNPNTGLLEDYRVFKNTGGEVEVPNAPAEPDERINKFTGLPYNIQAGTAYMDADDPLRRLGFMGGGTVDPLARLGFGYGGRVKEFDGGMVKNVLARLQFNKGGEVPFEPLTTTEYKSTNQDPSKSPISVDTQKEFTREEAMPLRKLTERPDIIATEIIKKNIKVPFVNRMVDSSNPHYTKAIETKEGRETHRMANRGNFAYPTIFVNPETNKLEKLTGNAAFKRAKNTKDVIEFDNKKQAAWFATNNYKLAEQVKPFFRMHNPEKAVEENIIKTGYDVRAIRRSSGLAKTTGDGDLIPLRPIKKNEDILSYMKKTFFDPTQDLDFDEFDNAWQLNEANKAFQKAMKPIIGANFNIETTSWCAALISNILKSGDTALHKFSPAKNETELITYPNPKSATKNYQDFITASNRAVEFSRLGKNIFDSSKPWDKNAMRKIKAGDIFVVSNTKQRITSDNSFGKSGGHVGIVVSVNDDGTINVLGGNQANSINVSKFDVNSIKDFKNKKAFRIQRLDEQGLLNTPPETIEYFNKIVKKAGSTN